MKSRRTEKEMTELRGGVSRQGLIEAVGQELKPCGQQSGNNPVKLGNGQWSLRFNFEHPGHLKMLVDVVISAPIPMTAELCSELHEPEVEELRDWLGRIVDAMNGRSGEHPAKR
jgi:hypothetical protein